MARPQPALAKGNQPSTLDRLVGKKQLLMAQLRALEGELKTVNGELLTLVKRDGVADEEGKISLLSGDTPVRLIQHPGVPKIDKKLLLHYGVKPTIIVKSTIQTPYEYVLLGKPECPDCDPDVCVELHRDRQQG